MNARPPDHDHTRVDGPAGGGDGAPGADYYRTREAVEYLARAREAAEGAGPR